VGVLFLCENRSWVIWQKETMRVLWWVGDVGGVEMNREGEGLNGAIGESWRDSCWVLD